MKESNRDDFVPLSQLPFSEAETSGTQRLIVNMAKNSLVLQETLSALGFRRFKLLPSSSHSLFLETTENQILRINFENTVSNEHARVEIPEMLQAYKTLHDAGTDTTIDALEGVVNSIEVIPRCVNGVNQEEFQEFLKRIEEKYPDSQPTFSIHDVTRLAMPDGSKGPIVIVDRDAFENPEKAVLSPDFTIKPSIKRYDSQYVKLANVDQMSRFEELAAENLIATQELCYQQLLPRNGNKDNIRGVLTDAELDEIEQALDPNTLNFVEDITLEDYAALLVIFDKLQESRPGSLEGLIIEKPDDLENVKTFVNLVKAEGWYPSQAIALMRKQGILEIPEDIKDTSPEEVEVETGKKRILIIEDEESVANVMVVIMTRQGYEVDVADNHGDAKEMLQEINDDNREKYDLIVSDNTIAGQGNETGVRFAEEYHDKKFKGSPIPIILASAEDEECQAAVKAGHAVAFLHKPYKTNAVLPTIEEALEKTPAVEISGNSSVNAGPVADSIQRGAGNDGV